MRVDSFSKEDGNVNKSVTKQQTPDQPFNLVGDGGGDQTIISVHLFFYDNLRKKTFKCAP